MSLIQDVKELKRINNLDNTSATSRIIEMSTDTKPPASLAKIRNTRGRFTELFEAIVVSNNNVLLDGKIQVFILDETSSPDENIYPDFYKLHKSYQMYEVKNDGTESESANQDWLVKSNIVDCWLSSPISGSYQNSGLFSCPAINSRGIVLRLRNRDSRLEPHYYWITGVFKSKKLNDDNFFLPFPSNIPENTGIDFEEKVENDDKNYKNKFNKISYETDGTIKTENQNEYVSSGLMFDIDTNETTYRSKNMIILRTVYPGGDRIKNPKDYRQDKNTKLLKTTERDKFLLEFDSSKYPTETLMEISASRFFIHKATEWNKVVTLAKLDELTTLNDNNTDKQYNLIIDKDFNLIPTKWVDFTINNLNYLDKSRINKKINNETEGLEGFGYCINDFTDANLSDKKTSRNLFYSTSVLSRNRFFYQNESDTEDDYRLVDLNVDNKDESKIEFTLSKKESEIFFSLDLDNKKITITNENSKSGETYLTELDLNTDSNSIQITAKKDDIENIIFLLDGKNKETSLIQKNSSTSTNSIILKENEITISNKITTGTNKIVLSDSELSITDKMNNTIKFESDGITLNNHLKVSK